ncbi:MAG: extracellular solute-binding protein [Bacillota bacterium]|jgi:multiple sugar transport system substrate-binding protein
MYKKVKMLSVLALLMFLATVLLAGCGSSKSGESGESGSDKDVTISALFMKQAGYSEDDVRNMTKEFESNNPGIKVNLTFLAYEALHDKIITNVASGTNSFDVVPVDDPWLAEFAQAGIIKDISAQVTAEMKEEVFPAAMETFAFQGKQYAIPWNNDTKFFFYNKKMLADAGFEKAPATWEEFVTMAKAIKDKGIAESPSIWSWSQAEALVCDYQTFLSAFGGRMLDDDLNPVFNEKPGVDALQFMVDLQKDGLANASSTQSLEEDVRRVFSQGKVAFATNWTYMYNLAKDPNESTVTEDVGIALMPDKKSVYGAMGLAMSSTTKNDEAVWKFIEYLTSKEVQKKYAALSLPIWKTLYDDPELVEAQPELVAVAKEQYENVESRARTPWYPELSQALQLEIQNALTGNKDPQKALDDAATKVEEIKNSYSK